MISKAKQKPAHLSLREIHIGAPRAVQTAPHQTDAAATTSMTSSLARIVRVEAADAGEEVQDIGQGNDTAEVTGHGGTCRGDRRRGGMRGKGRCRLRGCRRLVGRVEGGMLGRGG